MQEIINSTLVQCNTSGHTENGKYRPNADRHPASFGRMAICPDAEYI